MKMLLLSGLFFGLSTLVFAGEPQVPSKPPYIVLSENHDEPNGYGFCLDTVGRGQSDRLHTHSCKPAREGAARTSSSNDTRFEYNADTMQIASYPFIGYCMQVVDPSQALTEFALLECSDNPNQKFSYNPNEQTIVPHGNPTLCLGVASETVQAGPWVKRALTLTQCSDTDATLLKWTIIGE